MSRVRLGAVGYLNARPLVFGLERSARFDVRFDVPSKCAQLLHEHRIDVGLIPSIEYLRDREDGSPPPQAAAAEPDVNAYRIVPDLAIASRGPVASVALYTRRPIGEVRSIALDTSSRTSVALVRVLCARQYQIDPTLEEFPPDLELMLGRCDAALMIGDKALFSDHDRQTEKIDLGKVWTDSTGLPFVWAFWAGRFGALNRDDVAELQHARDAGVQQPEPIARQYFDGSPDRQAAAARYLQDNIKYYLGPDERAGLELFFRYAAETGLVPPARQLRFFEA
jgi:chorismate dehydratase